MVERFTTVFDEDMRRRATATGLSVRQIMAIAALVEKETARAEERPLVAAVYRNRFRIGMPMQADPDRHLRAQAGRALERQHPPGRPGRSTRRTTPTAIRACRRVRSPHRARPPSRRRSRPPKVDYLYFVSRNDGSHAFAATLPEHNRNVQKWQVDYFRDAVTPNSRFQNRRHERSKVTCAKCRS